MQLTNEKRGLIKAALMKRGMTAAEDAFRDAQKKAGMEAYDRLYPPGTQVRRMLDDAAGKGWFAERDEIYLADKENAPRCECEDGRFDKHRAILNCHDENWSKPAFIVSKETLKALDKQRRALLDRGNALGTKIDAVLQSCRSWKQLYEAWPSATDVIAPFEPVKDKPMTVRPSKALDSELGLPP